MNTLATYTANVRAAVNAYAADQAVTEGWCAICKHRRVNTTNRRYRDCIAAGATENGLPE